MHFYGLLRPRPQDYAYDKVSGTSKHPDTESSFIGLTPLNSDACCSKVLKQWKVRPALGGSKQTQGCRERERGRIAVKDAYKTGRLASQLAFPPSFPTTVIMLACALLLALPLLAQLAGANPGPDPAAEPVAVELEARNKFNWVNYGCHYGEY
jgi:hypothetical protein